MREEEKGKEEEEEEEAEEEEAEEATEEAAEEGVKEEEVVDWMMGMTCEVAAPAVAGEENLSSMLSFLCLPLPLFILSFFPPFLFLLEGEEEELKRCTGLRSKRKRRARRCEHS